MHYIGHSYAYIYRYFILQFVKKAYVTYDLSRVSKCTFHTFFIQITSCNMNTLCCFSIFSLTFFSGDVKSVLIYLFIDIYVVFISSIADDKYHGYQSLAGYLLSGQVTVSRLQAARHNRTGTFATCRPSHRNCVNGVPEPIRDVCIGPSVSVHLFMPK